MAEADAKLTGRPGVLFVTRGPGRRMPVPACTWRCMTPRPWSSSWGRCPWPSRPRRVPGGELPRAFRPAGEMGGGGGAHRPPRRIHRPRVPPGDAADGPARSCSPCRRTSCPPRPSAGHGDRRRRPAPGSTTAAIAEAAGILTAAERPMILLGGSLWGPDDGARAAELATRLGAPLAVTFRRQDFVDNDHPNYAGDLGVGMNPALGAACRRPMRSSCSGRSSTTSPRRTSR
jgi:acetolactate synthase-1/2/3 large subunit